MATSVIKDVRCDVIRDDSICEELTGRPAWAVFLRLQYKESSSQYKYYLDEGNPQPQFDPLPPFDDIQGPITVIDRKIEERSLYPTIERRSMLTAMIQEIVSTESHYEFYLTNTILRKIDETIREATGPTKMGIVVNITMVEFDRQDHYAQPEEGIATSPIIVKVNCEVHRDDSICKELSGWSPPGTVFFRFQYKAATSRYNYYLDEGSDEPRFDPLPPFDDIQVPIIVEDHKVEQTMSLSDLSALIEQIISIPPHIAEDYIMNESLITVAEPTGQATDPTQLCGIIVNITRAEFELSIVQFVRASETAIQNSEKLKYEGSINEDCVICMEKLEKGVEVIVTPCSHVYHTDCICTWLSTGHVCPLCRYEFPVD